SVVSGVLSIFFVTSRGSSVSYSLSLHDALPICFVLETNFWGAVRVTTAALPAMRQQRAGRVIVVSSVAGLIGAVGMAYYSASKLDRKSTRLNSSHQIISYALFCLKKNKPPPSAH